MDYNNKQYFVLPVDMLTQLDFNSLEDTSYETVRTSVDGTMAIVEYKGQIQFMGTYLTHQEALALMQTPEWYTDTELLAQQTI